MAGEATEKSMISTGSWIGGGNTVQRKVTELWWNLAFADGKENSPCCSPHICQKTQKLYSLIANRFCF